MQADSQTKPPDPVKTATGLYLAAFRDMPDPEFTAAVNSGELAKRNPFHLDAEAKYKRKGTAFLREVDELGKVVFNRLIKGTLFGFPFEARVSVVTFNGIYIALETELDVHTVNFTALDRQAIREGVDLELAAVSQLLADKGRKIRECGIIWVNGNTCKRVTIGESVILAARKKLPEIIQAYAARTRGEKYIRIPNVLSKSLPSIERVPVECVLTRNIVRENLPESQVLEGAMPSCDHANALRRESADEILRRHFPETGRMVQVATNGETDAWHMAIAFLKASGEKPTDLAFSTWAMSKIVANELCEKIKKEWAGVAITILVSTLFKGRYSAEYAQLVSTLSNNRGRLICANQHAKIFLARTKNHHLAFVTSANMDKNLNLETYTLFNDRTTYDFWRGVFKFYEFHLAAN